MNNKFILLGTPCHIELTTYANNGRLAVLVRMDDEYQDFVCLSVNLVDEENVEPDCAFIDTNNCPYAESFLLEYGLATPIGVGFSGFCTYPLYRFDLEKIKRNYM